MSTFLFLSLLAGAAQAAPEVNPATQQIVNGSEIGKKRFEAAVAIGFDAQGITQSTCSASLITPRLLLTAAHCTEEFTTQYGIPQSAVLNFGAMFIGREVAAPDQVVGWEDYQNHPGYTGSQRSIRNDIGVITLDSAVKGVDPTWFRVEPLSDEEAIGAKVTSVGYGITSSRDQRSGGIRRSANLTVDQIDDQFLYSYAETNPNGANVCSGDSGGPQYHRYADGTLEQWAVHSFVYAVDFSGANDPCLSASGSTNVSEFSDWILDIVDDVHGSTDKCEVNNLYDDRICQADCFDPDPDCEIDANGDGVVTDEEFDSFDRDNDGEITDKELAKGGAACSGTGSAPAWLPLLGLLGLAARRRRD